jgi:hypothetical protein
VPTVAIRERRTVGQASPEFEWLESGAVAPMDGLEFNTAQGLIQELKPSGCYGEPASILEVRIDDGQSPGSSETLGPSHWLLHEVQGHTRDHERQADYDEEWSASNRGTCPVCSTRMFKIGANK